VGQGGHDAGRLSGGPVWLGTGAAGNQAELGGRGLPWPIQRERIQMLEDTFQIIGGTRQDAAYWAQNPPSTRTVSPVTKLAASLARKMAGPTSSAGLAVRPIGIACTSFE
jgi:hypothetical protein